MELLNKKSLMIRIILLFLVVLLTIWAIVYFVQKYLYKSKASEREVKVYFEKNNISLNKGEIIKVNIFFQNSPSDKISGATVSLTYPKDKLEYMESTTEEGYVQVKNDSKTIEGESAIAVKEPADTCALTSKLDKIFNVSNNSSTGILSISRVSIEKEDNLPSGLFCFGTVMFKPKSGITLPQTITLSLNDDTTKWEIVGPNNSFRPILNDTTKVVRVALLPEASISVSPLPGITEEVRRLTTVAPTYRSPTPTSIQTPSGISLPTTTEERTFNRTTTAKSCSWCGTVCVESTEGLNCPKKTYTPKNLECKTIYQSDGKITCKIVSIQNLR